MWGDLVFGWAGSQTSQLRLVYKGVQIERALVCTRVVHNSLLVISHRSGMCTLLKLVEQLIFPSCVGPYMAPVKEQDTADAMQTFYSVAQHGPPNASSRPILGRGCDVTMVMVRKGMGLADAVHVPGKLSTIGRS